MNLLMSSKENSLELPTAKIEESLHSCYSLHGLCSDYIAASNVVLLTL